MDLLPVLQATLSPTDHIRKEAENFIAKSKSDPAFSLALCNFIQAGPGANSLHGSQDGSSSVIPLETVRFSAAVLLKNSVVSVWGKADEAQKNAMKLFCLSQVQRETNINVAEASADVLGRIARFEFPSVWPNLLQDLLACAPASLASVLNASGAMPVSPGAGGNGRSLPDAQRERVWVLFLSSITDYLASRVVFDGRRVFEQIAPQLFELALKLWIGHAVSDVCSSVGNDADEYSPFVQIYFLCMSVMKQSLAHGMEIYNDLPHRDAFFGSLASQLGVLFNMMVSFSPNDRNDREEDNDGDEVDYPLAISLPFDLFSRMLRLVTVCAERYPSRIGDVLKAFFPFCLSVLGHNMSRPGISLFHTPLIRCLEFLKYAAVSDAILPVCLTPSVCSFFSSLDHKPEREKQQILSSTNGPALQDMQQCPVWELLWVCIDKFLIMTPKEFHLWRSDPNAFLTSDSADLENFGVKSAAETLVVLLLQRFDTVLPVAMAQSLETRIREAGDELVLDARLRALGIGFFDLSPSLGQFFAPFCKELLVPLFQSPSVLLKRRACWLCACCVRDLPTSTLPAIYQGMIACLGDSDLVVRTAAAEALHTLAVDVSCQPEALAASLPRALPALFNLTLALTLCEQQTNVWRTVDAFVSQCGRQMCAFAAEFLSSLSALWQSSQDRIGGGGGELVQATVLNSLATFVRTAGEEGHEAAQRHCLEAACGLIGECVREPTKTEFYLVEAGTDLWSALFSVSRGLAEERLFELFGMLPALVRDVPALYAPSMSLLEHYLAGPVLARRLLMAHGDVVAGCLEALTRACQAQFPAGFFASAGAGKPRAASPHVSLSGSGHGVVGPGASSSRSWPAHLTGTLQRLASACEHYVSQRWPLPPLDRYLTAPASFSVGSQLAWTAATFASHVQAAGGRKPDLTPGEQDWLTALWQWVSDSASAGPAPSHALLVFARLLVQSPVCFFFALDQLKERPAAGASVVFFDRWFDCADNVRDLRQRKLLALASGALLLSPAYAASLPMTVSLVVDVQSDVVNRHHELDISDLPLIGGEEVLFAADPAVSVVLPEFLVLMIQQLDPQVRAQVTVDPVLQQQFQQLA